MTSKRECECELCNASKFTRHTSLSSQPFPFVPSFKTLYLSWSHLQSRLGKPLLEAGLHDIGLSDTPVKAGEIVVAFAGLASVVDVVATMAIAVNNALGPLLALALGMVKVVAELVAVAHELLAVRVGALVEEAGGVMMGVYFVLVCRDRPAAPAERFLSVVHHEGAYYGRRLVANPSARIHQAHGWLRCERGEEYKKRAFVFCVFFFASSLGPRKPFW